MKDEGGMMKINDYQNNHQDGTHLSSLHPSSLIPHPSILIVKLGSIGDIVHTLPAAAVVRASLPQARIAWAVERHTAEILRGTSIVDELIELDTRELRRLRFVEDARFGWRAQVQNLRRNSFDVALDFQGLWKSAAVAFLSGAPKRYGFNRQSLREPSSRVLLTNEIRVPSDVHVIRKNLLLVRDALGINVSLDADDWRFPIAISEEHEAETAKIISQVGTRFAILNPGGNWWTKRWSAERFGELADEILRRHNLPSVVPYAPAEEDLAKRVVAASRTNAAQMRQLSLKGFFALARNAQIYVGGDTGLTHLAIAAGAPVVGLFGPTEWWRNGSPHADDSVVERNDINCRVNCHRRSCDKWICMNIEVARVASAVDERLARVHKITSQKEAANDGFHNTQIAYGR